MARYPIAITPVSKLAIEETECYTWSFPRTGFLPSTLEPGQMEERHEKRSRGNKRKSWSGEKKRSSGLKTQKGPILWQHALSWWNPFLNRPAHFQHTRISNALHVFLANRMIPPNETKQEVRQPKLRLVRVMRTLGGHNRLVLPLSAMKTDETFLSCLTVNTVHTINCLLSTHATADV